MNQWDHLGAKHGAAHGDATLDMVAPNNLYVHWIKKVQTSFFLYYKHHKLVYTITFYDFGNIYRGVGEPWEI